MWMPGVPNWLVLSFVMAALVEVYFFLMQRAALSVCRDNDIPAEARMLMVPGWYRLAWLAIGAKWATVVLIFINGGWLWALAAIVFSFALATFLPVPFGHFIPILTRHLQTLISNGSPEALLLLSALRRSIKRHGLSIEA